MAKANGGNNALTNRIQSNTQPEQQDSPEKTIAQYLKKMAPQFEAILPKHVGVDRMMRVAMNTIRTNPKLLQCEVSSLMAAVMQASILGLEPGVLGHCYLLPFRNNKENRMDVQFIIGYRGMIDLARRSGNIRSISAHEVYSNDYIELTYGLEENLKHIPWHLRTDHTFDKSGELRGCYMVAHFNDGGHYLHYMPKSEIEDHKKRSKTSDNGPWVTDYIEMCKKTVVRSAWKWLPISVEIAQPVAENDEAIRKDPLSNPEFFDLSSSDVTITNEVQNDESTTREEDDLDRQLDEAGLGV